MAEELNEPAQPLARYLPESPTVIGQEAGALSGTVSQHAVAQSPVVPGSSSSNILSTDLVFDPRCPAAGMRIGQYRLLQKLGEGGMGSVWKANHTLLDKAVAIKLLSPHLIGTPQIVARFEREMKAVGRLDHPNLVRAYDAGEVGGTRFLVMEFIDGIDLATYVKKNGPLTATFAARVIEQAALGLGAAHQAGLVHRDIKPGNLMLTADGEIKVTDLGLALLGDEPVSAIEPGSLTSVGMILGTPDYMAPEQWDNTHGVDGRCDLYSLGCTLFFLLTGVPPFWDRKGHSAKMQAHATFPPPDLAAARAAWAMALGNDMPTLAMDSGVSSHLEAVVRKLLAKTAAARYQTCMDLLVDVAPLLPNSRTASLSPSTVVLPELVSDHGPKRPQRAPVVTAMKASAILATTCLFAIGLWYAGTRGGGKRPTVAKDSRSKITKLDSDSRHTSASASHQKPGWQDWPANAPAPAISPYNEVRAYRMQEAWASYLDLPIEFTNSVGMKFRLIPPGEFKRGSPPEEIEATIQLYGQQNPEIVPVVRSAGPLHNCILSQPFYMGAHEVTQQQYERVIGSNPSYFSKAGEGRAQIPQQDTSRFPVEQVSWIDQALFCGKLAEIEGIPARYVRDLEAVKFLGGPGYRLPSDAEWEFACRAGTTTRYWSGSADEALNRVGWWAGNSGGISHAVGQLAPNPFGLFDVHGNVAELTEDAVTLEDYVAFASAPAKDPLSLFTNTMERAVRGGCIEDVIWQSSGYRRFLTSRDSSRLVGFRVALGIDAVRLLLKAARTSK
jgi:eukaryotic-like serine/threonine-protein kinase